MEERQILMGLTMLQGVGRRTVSRLFSSGIKWHDIFEFGEKEWMGIGLTVEHARQASILFTREWAIEQWLQVQQAGIGVITYLDDDYPILMKETPDPAWVLYFLGDRSLLDSVSVAMVGTRVPTAYGRKMAETLAAELSANGYTIVSGMARGIDSICHEAVLRCGGSTLAVLGTAIDVAYPLENTSLYKEIVRRGLVISEYPPGTKSHPGLFPQRNRIIAGLTRGTLVVEADIRSGSLITADAALESGRDVFAVPGPVTSPKSRGTLNLIKQGAKLVTEASDIMEEYGRWFSPADAEPGSFAAASAGNHGGSLKQNYSSDEERIVSLLEQGTLTVDELLTSTGWDFGLLHSVLLSLIIKKRVAQLAGLKYQLI
ncbi:DNA-processing protein DprA [Paenibacillus sp. P96]|uniref:DNA-processing protein DprA n=1 Tax=Paenibacillus zeirhizosphaerae TaxID=2987519 RepID=A0ABT9FS56_9BACL|nr:DNA-processing protein DprA [Paenibacillus sp. P96]MDP4097553.1 DNA-processing protein DprA [Paenibacillus sp. P96]